MNLIYLIGATLISITYAEIKDDSASNALNLFALKFLAETNRQLPEDTNLAISPYTIWTAMSILNEGARGNTAKELERTLLIPPAGAEREAFRKLQQRIIQNVEKKQEGVTLEVLNSLFTKLEATLYPEYIKLVQDIYKGQIESLDFKNGRDAAGRINKVISDATKGRIPQIVTPDLVQSAYMFITSALYFKGTWDKKFDKNLTSLEPFYNERKQPIGQVPMMQTTAAFPYSRILNGQAIAVELPYLGAAMSMIAILPTQEASLSSMLNELAGTSFVKLVDDLHETRQSFSAPDVLVLLPKFKISSTLTINSVLDVMGIKDVFNSRYANLTSISANELYVSRLLHKAEIEVNEEGSTGSAATVLEIADKISDLEFFTANKPFAYFVYDKKNKLIIFAGKFVNPIHDVHS